jgi:hypothetical protein
MHGSPVGELFALPGGSFVLRPRPRAELKRLAFAILRGQPDDSFLIRPEPEWITLARAAQILECDYSSVYRLLDRFNPDTRKPLLDYRKRLPGRIEVKLQAVLEVRRLSEERPDFWSDFERRSEGLQESGNRVSESEKRQTSRPKK